MASTPCPRCGTFAPLSTFWGKTLCDACIARRPSVFRGPLTVQQLADAIWAIPIRVWLWSAALHLMAAIPALIRTWFGSGGPGWLLDLPLNILGAALVTHLCVQTLRGEDASVGHAIRTVGRRFGTLLRVEFLSGIWIAAFGILLIVPGVLRALSLALTIPIVLFENAISFEVVADRSTKRMQGQRSTALSGYVIVWLPAMVVFMIGAYLTRDSDQSAHARLMRTVFDGVGYILGSATTLVTSVLYVSLTPPDALPLEEVAPSEEAPQGVAPVGP